MGEDRVNLRDIIAQSTRFFARPIAFDLECPHCGTVYQVRATAGKAKTDRSKNWDPFTARFLCTHAPCQRQYVIGLLAWPIVAGPRIASATPEDQVPSPRQLAQLRREGGGWWLTDDVGQRHTRPHTTNLTTEEDRPDEDEDTEG